MALAASLLDQAWAVGPGFVVLGQPSHKEHGLPCRDSTNHVGRN